MGVTSSGSSTTRSDLAVQRNDVKLLPGERLERVHELEIVDPPATPDPLEELCKLARVVQPEEVGRNGPLVAARATDGNAGEAALRLFEIVYGRDSLVAALFVGDLFPLLREATVLSLAHHQGKRYDPWHDEEPGRIAHMIRNTIPDAKLGYPYYGTVDATPHFISAAMHAIKARPTFQAEIRHALDGAVAWLLRRLGTDELGLLSHQRVNPHGIANQVWKDSWDSMSHADGTVANHAAPVASLEAQALAYDALVEVGELHAADRLTPDRSRSTFGSAISTRSASTVILRPAHRVRSLPVRRTWAGCCARGCSMDAKIANDKSSSCSSPMNSSPSRVSARSRTEKSVFVRAVTTTGPSGRTTTT